MGAAGERPSAPSWGRLAFCVSGIYSAYLTQGYVQESLSTTKYAINGEEPERFPHLEALNGMQCVSCFLVAGLLLLIMGKASKDDGPVASPLEYWRPALTNAIGPACGIISLKNISYPAQVLAKSSKAIPVMVMGTLVGGKVYSTLEYLSSLLIAAGISMFAYKGSSKVASKLASPNAPLGYGLCFINLMLDGFTNATQDSIHTKYPGTGALHTMCYMNMWCGAYYMVYLFGPVQLLGQKANVGLECIDFCLRHRDAAVKVALFCLCGAWGQIFIFHTLKLFGALINTLITTTRKFFNILLSVVLNGNPLLPQQWVAIALVFSGLSMHSLMKRKVVPKGKKA